jgi:oligopeptide/dipeptide ABC transporter ATP-binding protein
MLLHRAASGRRAIAAETAPAADAPVALLEVEDLVKHYPVESRLLAKQRAMVRAVDGVSLRIAPGETLGLVGESGCGKSTLARCVARLIAPSAGRILLKGEDVTTLPEGRMRPLRRHVQMVFQDPFSSLNPRHRAAAIVAEPLLNFGIATRREAEPLVRALFERVGLTAAQMRNYPHEFSGGQRQRLGIARALAVDPALIVCDEAVSALDVSVQAQVINLLRDLQEERGVAYLFVAHDLAVVGHISQRVAVMYLGRIVETGPKARVFASPLHPYTQALMAAVPIPDPHAPRRHAPVEGELPSPLAPPSGCTFHTRCPLAEERCRREIPQLRETEPGHYVACHLR